MGVVNYDKELARNVNDVPYQLQLKGVSGHAAFPGYMVISGANEPEQKLSIVCTYNESAVLRLSFVFTN